MAKISNRDIEAALKEEQALEKEEIIGLKVNRKADDLVGGMKTTKTVEGLAKREDNRVYGKGGPK